MPFEKRDSKDPMPNAKNSERQPPDGNTPATGEMHNSAKAEHVRPDQRYTIRTGGETQPTRQRGDGNTPVTGEMHNSPKGEWIREDQRW